MAGWVKTPLKLQEFMGLMKDQVSLTCAMAKKGQFAKVNLAILRATSHDEQLREETVKVVLAIGGGSRMSVAYCIRTLMDRLNNTRNWIVALKCLMLIHRCLHEGGFMFQDQLSVHPASGGRNYLNLSKFRDTHSPFTWSVSAFVRWYARIIEQCIQTSRSIGAFLDIKIEDKSLHTEKLLSLPTAQLVKEIMSLDDFLRQALGWQAEEFVMDHFLVKEGLRLAIQTTMRAYEEIKLRLQEVLERIMTLTRTEASELVQVCERLSTESMLFSHMFELGEDLCLQSSYAIPGQIVYKDYELMKLKEALKLAALLNVTSSPSQPLVNVGFRQPWSSMRWEKSNIFSLGIGESRRGKSMSEFNFYETPL